MSLQLKPQTPVARSEALFTPPPPPHLATVKLRVTFGNQMQLHVISWNACGITHWLKLSALKGYVYHHHPDLIFIQEAYVARSIAMGGEAPSLSGYISYVHLARNGIITYVHCSIQHRFLRCYTGEDMTFQLFEVVMGNDTLRLCNIYSPPGRINLTVLPIPTIRGTIYLGDFNCRHPALGDVSHT